MTSDLGPARLAAALQQAVSDALADAPRFDPPPNLDLAVLALPRGGAPVWANVLFSREFPAGRVARIGADAAAVQGVRLLADARGPDGSSLAWVAGSDWTALPAATFAPLAGGEPGVVGAVAPRFIAPYPASLIKLMVVVAVAALVDAGRATWDESLRVFRSCPLITPKDAQALSAPSRARLWTWLRGQALHKVLSATLLAGTPGWQPGIPARLPARWVTADGGVVVAGSRLPPDVRPDVRPANAAADATFAHKTGSTASYASDAGLVQGDGAGAGAAAAT